LETSLTSPKIYCKYGDVPGVSKNLLQIWRRLRCLQKLSANMETSLTSPKNLLQIWRRPRCLQKLSANMETSLTSPKIYCKYGDVQGVSKNLMQIWRRP